MPREQGEVCKASWRLWEGTTSRSFRRCWFSRQGSTNGGVGKLSGERFHLSVFGTRTIGRMKVVGLKKKKEPKEPVWDWVAWLFECVSNSDGWSKLGVVLLPQEASAATPPRPTWWPAAPGPWRHLGRPEESYREWTPERAFCGKFSGLGNETTIQTAGTPAQDLTRQQGDVGAMSKNCWN